MRMLLLTGLAAALAFAQTARPNIDGVYAAIGGGGTVAGFRNAGAPAEISLKPEAMQQAKSVNLKDDPAKWCQPVGPFRMMARERNKIEIVTEGSLVAILFEDVSHGLMRKIEVDEPHEKLSDPDLAFTWMGDSVAKWERDTLVVDTTGFNDRTWLNENGAQHSEAFHLIERIRPMAGGKYLEYKVTAEDPKVLTKPYTYTRYFEKTNREIAEDICDYEN